MIRKALTLVLSAAALVACTTESAGDADNGAAVDDALNEGVVYANVRPASYGKTGEYSWKPEWNEFIATAIRTHGKDLIQGPNEPIAAMKELCPQYATASEAQKIAIWALVVAEVARYESAFKTDDKYPEPGQCTKNLPKELSCKATLKVIPTGAKFSVYQKFSEGLLSVSTDDWERYPECESVRDAESVVDPESNLSCGIAILAKQVRTAAARGGFVLFPSKIQDWSYWSVLTTTATKIKSDFAIDSKLLKHCR